MTQASVRDAPESNESKVLEVADQPADWTYYRENVANYIPDPMILRAGDVFLMGKKQASADLPKMDEKQASAIRPKKSDDEDQVWRALDRNVSGILCFFDLLVTHDRLPLINYGYTFGANVFDKELKGRTVRIAVVNKTHYQRIKDGALVNLRRCKTSALTSAAVREVTQELSAFAWDWKPDLVDVKVSKQREPIAQFLLGGFIFGGYAQVSGTEFIIQSKRSRLFLALSLPKAAKRSWAYDREQKLFEKLRDVCRTEAHVRYEEFPAAPSIVPYLLARQPRPPTPRALLSAVLEFRDSPEGKKYLDWLRQLRGGLSRGYVDSKAERDIERVAAELNRRFGVGAPKASEARLSFDVSGHVNLGVVGARGRVKLKNMPVQLPRAEWLRRFIIENTTLRQGHSRVLLRLSLAQREYENLVLGLKGIWQAG